MTGAAPLKLGVWVRRLATFPLYVLYGAWFLVSETWRLVSRARAGVRLLRSSLPCPSCGEANPLHGKWRCHCGAVFHGFVAACPLCGSGASAFRCRRCGVSIKIGRTG